jgi:1-aminocyclopropane-1-carboxylate deaminase/D-cysteine desulfhydrase-like pyridoxal-dependent ACC family enzyme
MTSERDIDKALDLITPVQFDQGLYWKRDDHFRPFGDLHHVNGGKVRQAIMVFRSKLEELRNPECYDNGVVTAASVYSPQSANIAKVAQHYGVKCISTVGGTTEAGLLKHSMMRLTRHYGSEIRIVAGHGMTAVIHSRMHDIAKKLNYLPIEMGELMEQNPSAIFESTARQVQNLPDNLDVLVVPTGVAIQLTGILRGIREFDKKVKRIVCVCVGPTREKQLKHYLNDIYQEETAGYHPVEMFAHKAPYSKGYDVMVNGEYIDDLYEGKAFHWMTQNIDYRNEKTCFWVVGKRPRVEDVDNIINNML